MHGGGLTVTAVSFPAIDPAERQTTGHPGTIRAGRGVGALHHMTNQDRIKRRIERDKARKAEKRRPLIEQHGMFENVITMQNLHRSLKHRRKEVEWKGSVQRYIAHAPVRLKRTKDELLAGDKLSINRTIRRRKIYERGKARDIHAIMIDARVIQGCLCDSCITPLSQPTLIYDNPASTAGKGVSHARRRNKKFLLSEVRKHGTDLYAMSYDYTGYFKSIRHSVCRVKLTKIGLDDRLTNLTMEFIKMYLAQDFTFIRDRAERDALMRRLAADELEGATLGSQISQDMALLVPNGVDHAVKDRQHTKSYIRFMDDGIAYGTKSDMESLLDVVRSKSSEVCLNLNQKKTQIVKMTKGTTFLKVQYIVTRSRRIICKLAHDSVVRERRKLKKFRAMIDRGEMALHDAYVSFKTWCGNVKRIASTYRQRKRMLCLYNSLFHGYGLKGMRLS